ncbi:MAG: amino acid adenylation domain-containing protein [Gammaproteobacteria bacterium]|nr:amino acid adenylation domain-containing protein [Gammaproteobacteria bacterium]
MSETTIAKHFSLTAGRHPDNVAIWSAQGSVSYAELDCQSSALATWLQNHRGSKNGLLGIMLPKSVEAVVAIIAALKANMPYAPVDPTWPQRRLESVFLQSRFDIVVTSAESETQNPEQSTTLRTGTSEWESATTMQSDTIIPLEYAAPDDLAYVLYTSGSTGEPKGVCVSSRAAYYFPNWARSKFSVDSSSRIASLAPFTFDLSTFDLFSGLCGGATVYLVPESTKLLPTSLSRFFEEHRITIIYSVPSNLGLLAARGMLGRRNLNSLTTVLFAGEVFPLPLFRKFEAQLPGHVQYYNLYGPTETNVFTYFELSALREDDVAIPIGIPLPGTRAFTIPSDSVASDTKLEGELCVIGPGVMSGYWGKQNETLDCWTSAADDPDAIAYRTGDLVSLSEEGNWQYISRVDNMVKIWGYRVELGEIESCLLSYPNVEQAAVVKISKEDEFGDSLVAFIVTSKPGDSEEVKPKDLLKHCKENLPSYMLPQRIRSIEHMPLSDNGKIERRKLVDLAIRMQSADEL